MSGIEDSEFFKEAGGQAALEQQAWAIYLVSHFEDSWSERAKLRERSLLWERAHAIADQLGCRRPVTLHEALAITALAVSDLGGGDDDGEEHVPGGDPERAAAT